MDLYLTSRHCKGHSRPIMTLTKPPSCLLEAPLLILPGSHLLLVPSQIHIMSNQLIIRFTLMLSHSLIEMHLIRGGGPNTTLISLIFLHHLLIHNHRLLLPQGNPKCLPNHNAIHLHLHFTPPLNYPYHFQSHTME